MYRQNFSGDPSHSPVGRRLLKIGQSSQHTYGPDPGHFQEQGKGKDTARRTKSVAATVSTEDEYHEWASNYCFSFRTFCKKRKIIQRRKFQRRNSYGRAMFCISFPLPVRHIMLEEHCASLVNLNTGVIYYKVRNNCNLS